MKVQRTDITDRPTAADAASLVDEPMARFVAGELDSVWVVGSRFNSVLSTPPTADRVLPVQPPALKGAQKEYLLFPSARRSSPSSSPRTCAMRSIAHSSRLSRPSRPRDARR